MLEKTESQLDMHCATIDDGDTLAKVNSNMEYKYLFKCTDIKYHSDSGRVKSMIFLLCDVDDAYVDS